MEIYRSISEIVNNKKTVLSIGMFDGVHKAHQTVLKLVRENTKKIGGRCLIVTFDPHPKEIVAGDKSKVEILTTLDEKLQLFEKYGIDEVFVIPFTYEFSRLTLEQFYLEYIINGTGVSKVIEGFNHQLGRDREGSMQQVIDLGKRYDFSVDMMPMMSEGEISISSSKIREMLHTGAIGTANRMIGREYSFSGVVVRGYGRGKKLGYPTANIQLDNPKKLVPKIGVYAVRFFVQGEWFQGMMSIGHNPTFHESHERTTEVNIFDFDREIYGETVTVQCIERTRDEMKFSSIEDLVSEMGRDKTTTQQILEHYTLLS
jgi:riboflavin kinase / FMN adenylyltransferase